MDFESHVSFKNATFKAVFIGAFQPTTTKSPYFTTTSQAITKSANAAIKEVEIH